MDYEISKGKKCSIINCNKPSVAKSYCSMHYKRLYRHGDVTDKHSKLVNGVQRTKHPLYSVWSNITRTAKGNLACEEWKDFNNFIRDVKEKPSENVHFVRIDSSKKYSPDNVYWKLLTNTEEFKEYRRDYMRNYSKKLRETNPSYFKEKHLKKHYGITLEWYNEQHEKQNGLCAICGKPETAVVRGNRISLAVDHCHETGKVRGLLCRACNNAIGAFNHDINVLNKAIAYLG